MFLGFGVMVFKVDYKAFEVLFCIYDIVETLGFGDVWGVVILGIF